MGSEDGGLAKHNNKCDYEINWEHADIIGEEQGGRQRKVREGIESIKAEQRGLEVLNSHEQLQPWRATIFDFLENQVIRPGITDVNHRRQSSIS